MRLHERLRVALIVCVLVGTTANAFARKGKSEQPIRDYCYFLSQLIDLERLPFLEEGVTCKQFSSYDRKSRYDEATGAYLDWDANGDAGNYLRDEGKEAVMAEMSGPGCIYRIWSANPQGEIRFYLDGDTHPTFAFDFAQLFSGEIYPFVPPLVWQRRDPNGTARASHCYVPIPYAKSCKVTIYPRKGMYYHIGYMTFSPGTEVQAFRPQLSEKERDMVERVRKVLRNAFDPSTMTTDAGRAEVEKSIGRKDKVPRDPQEKFFARRRRKRARVAPGERAIIAEMKGPAMIMAFKTRLVCEDPYAYRRVLLRVYWDGEDRASIETPLSDFFGSSFGPTVYHSLPMGKTTKWFYSYWRMPFRKSARFVVVNDSGDTAQLCYRFVWRKTRLPENTAYFHARWRRDPFSGDFDYPFLECTGRGRFVGAAQFIHNIHGGWWGEGDEKVYVDGEKFPSTFGTGSEDYYGDAWGIRWFSNPYAGCAFSSTEQEDYFPGEMQSCYRWHISDFIPFERSFRVTIENYSAKSGPDEPKNDYSSVAYWYQMPGGSDFFQSYAARDRVVRVATPAGAVEAESLVPEGRRPVGLSIVTDDESDELLSGHEALRLTGPVGATFDLTLKAPVAQAYRVLPKTVAPTDASLEILKNGKPIGEKVALAEGPNPITVRLTSKPERADRGVAVIDYLELVPHRNYVEKWLIAGPFDNQGDEGFDRVYPPEKGFDRKATYEGIGGKKIAWREATADSRNGLVPLSDLVSPFENTVAYAICTVESSRQQTVDLFAGSDDGIKIWVNGEEVHSHHIHRGYTEDADHVKVALKEGKNTLLVKVDNGAGPMGFGLRITDPEDTLTFGLPK